MVWKPFNLLLCFMTKEQSTFIRNLCFNLWAILFTLPLQSIHRYIFCFRSQWSQRESLQLFASNWWRWWRWRSRWHRKWWHKRAKSPGKMLLRYLVDPFLRYLKNTVFEYLKDTFLMSLIDTIMRHLISRYLFYVSDRYLFGCFKVWFFW
jgi:hypothetical protein